MKKTIRILSELSLIGVGTLATVACSGNSIGGSPLEPGKPQEPEPQDEKYYQDLINENKINIDDSHQLLIDNENEYKNHEISKNDYQIAKDEINAEIYHFQAENNQYQYQILLLHGHGIIAITDIAQAIFYLTNKISNLYQEKTIKVKYPDDYSQTDIETINNDLKNSNNLKNQLEASKEKNND